MNRKALFYMKCVMVDKKVLRSFLKGVTWSRFLEDKSGTDHVTKIKVQKDPCLFGKYWAKTDKGLLFLAKEGGRDFTL